MKRPHLEGERLDAREMSNAAFTASMFAASVGMIWDLATGHVSAFDRILSSISDDESEVSRPAATTAPAEPIFPTRSQSSNTPASGISTDA